MKWTRSELLRQSQKVTFDEDVEIDASAFAGSSRINAVKDVRVDGSGWLDDEADRFYAEIHITGTMLCPDAITGEEIEVPFETDSDESMSSKIPMKTVRASLRTKSSSFFRQ